MMRFSTSCSIYSKNELKITPNRSHVQLPIGGDRLGRRIRHSTQESAAPGDPFERLIVFKTMPVFSDLSVEGFVLYA